MAKTSDKTPSDKPKKPAVKKAAAKKAVAKKAAAKKTAAKPAKPSKKTVAKKAPARKKTATKKKAGSKAALPQQRIISAAERQQMIAEAAYLRSESQAFLGDPHQDWLLAEAEIDGLLAKAGALVRD
jgi:hypothetical protein